MPGASTLARAIAKALAAGQVKKAARLEADAVLRRELWKLTEEQAIAKMQGKAVDISAYVIPGRVSKAALIARGYDRKTAENLTMRLYTKALKEQTAALNLNAAKPLPKIRPIREARETAAFPTLQPQLGPVYNPPLVIRELNAAYPNAPINTLAPLNNKVYRKYNTDAWVLMETRQGLPLRRRSAQGEWEPE